MLGKGTIILEKPNALDCICNIFTVKWPAVGFELRPVMYGMPYLTQENAEVIMSNGSSKSTCL